MAFAVLDRMVGRFCNALPLCVQLYCRIRTRGTLLM
jgi:hypothetical protein